MKSMTTTNTFICSSDLVVYVGVLGVTDETKVVAFGRRNHLPLTSSQIVYSKMTSSPGSKMKVYATRGLLFSPNYAEK